MRPYEGSSGYTTKPDGPPVIMCPNRFEQESLLVHWLAETVGFAPSETMLAREVPFMRSVVTRGRRAAGMIDLVIAADRHELQWLGLEMQAVYFSGPSMKVEFEALLHRDHTQPQYPLGKRRPDWRSSSAKRLMPQPQVKALTMIRWHSKIAVAVDTTFFFDSMGGPSEDPEDDLNAGDVV